jgi:uncharacterized protein (DUF1330 family)
MAAYLIGQVSVKDPESWKQYVAGVARSLESFGAQVVFRGHRRAVLAGGQPHESAVVIRFADHETLLGWFHSAAYQALIPVRERAADMVLASYEEMG